MNSNDLRTVPVGLPQNNSDIRQHRPLVRYEDEFLRPEMLKFVRKPDDPRLIPTAQDQARLVVVWLKNINFDLTLFPH